MKSVNLNFRLSAAILAAATFGAGAMSPAPALAATASVEPEESGVTTAPAPKHSWFFVQRGFVIPGTAIYDTNTGKYIAQVETPMLGDMAIDPAGKHYYVAETDWSRRLHGTRQDFISVYDSATLKLEGDIDIPGRILVGGREHNFIVSDDGKTAYVYNFSPVSSVNIVDLTKRKFVRSFELPGCADLILNPGVGLAALCSDGSIASINLTGAKEEITRSEPFFGATTDPIFDNVQYDKAKGQVVMLTYTGLVYTAKLGAKPTVSTPFSLQEAAGVRKGDTKPLDVNWYPGGGQPIALHRASGHLFVLMHSGEYWSHKDGGTEIWDLDLAAHKVVKRLSVDGHPSVLNVTQEAKPKLIVVGEGEGNGSGSGFAGTAQVIDPATGEIKQTIKNAGSGLIQVID
ncbi:amine dehydrogenase large subunit [Novosphingobium sp.]|uniref:amine dehydrogenase large subunit n=1 Tax=Novosphingobium sp. TaxID=1874826 RepID=UPI003D0A0E49